MVLLLPTLDQSVQGNFAATNFESSSRPSQPQTRTKSVPHARLTAANIKDQWAAGILTPGAYLLNLLLSLKAPGWRFHIPNVQSFCDTWGLNRRAFFRAKTQLLNLGFLDQTKLGTLTIWIRPESQMMTSEVAPLEALAVSQDDELPVLQEVCSPEVEQLAGCGDRFVTTEECLVIESAKSVIGSDTFVTKSDRFVTLTPLQLLDTKTSSASSDLTQLSNSSFSQQPESELEREKCIISSEEKEAFRNWLRKRAEQLPRMPAFLNQWLTSQMKKPENREEFLQHQERLSDRANNPPIALEMPTTLEGYLHPLARFADEEELRLNHLARLQVKWRMGGLMKDRAIAEAKILGFQVTNDGITEG